MNDELAQGICAALERIADVQERLLAIALESRDERMKLSEQMKTAMKAGFQKGQDNG